MPSAIESAKDKAKQSAQAQKDEGNQPMLGRMAERAASGLEQVSAKLRSKDVDGQRRPTASR